MGDSKGIVFHKQHGSHVYELAETVTSSKRRAESQTRQTNSQHGDGSMSTDSHWRLSTVPKPKQMLRKKNTHSGVVFILLQISVHDLFHNSK